MTKLQDCPYETLQSAVAAAFAPFLHAITKTFPLVLLLSFLTSMRSLMRVDRGRKDV